MTVAQPIDSETIITTGSSNFTDTLKNILELLDLEEDDDYGILKPTAYALKTAIALLKPMRSSSIRFFKPQMNTDKHR